MWYCFRQVFALARSGTVSLRHFAARRHQAIIHPIAAASVSLSVTIARTIPYAPAVISALAIPAHSAYTSARSAATQAQVNSSMLRAISWRSTALGPYGDYVAAALAASAPPASAATETFAAEHPPQAAGALSSASPLRLDEPHRATTPSERVFSGALDSQFASAMRQAGVLSSSIDAALDALPTMRALAGPLRGQRYRVLLGAAAGESSRTRRILVLEVHAVGTAPVRAIWYRPPSKRGGHFYAANGHSLQRGLDPRPVASARLSSRFGERVHPISKRRAFHSGVDWAAPRGTPVRASGAGTVAFAGWRHGYGKTIVVRHAQHYETVYAHLSRIPPKLKTGAKIARGDVIGYVGSTGWATGPHLHYEVRHQGRHVNPLAASVGQPASLRGATLHAFERYSANLLIDNDVLPPRVASQ
ncbi:MULTISPECIES: M23 family metallopeptidase [Burkholderiaceae]|uniref:M23 family metallopeptidase n=1 Tax=Burkholderiaceae TaxID=119060 RepID=UPI0009689035|nr:MULTISPECIES: M23 family metallopeptidase [Burkholderiaceae]MCG1040198.1 M23 family metallopeptidase [Mycetohabitans sp. B7]SIT73088.1 Murein DD-endopeptidase MepM and murein hydrolase activator NlpD, contain LysM domain [Burkholderia sp. b14]